MIFAEGCSFYKIVWIFILGAFLGDVVEMLFCRWRMGKWMSRSSVVWGPFSIVWGGSIALATILLYRYKDFSMSFLFIAGTLLGGVFEYFCSMFTEKVFGKVFWDYSKMKYNLNGRINLVYCMFWGLASVIWFKVVYPIISGWIEEIPVNIGVPVTWVLIAFMVCNMLVSCMALVRSDERTKGIEAKCKWQRIMDKHFSDEKLQKIYPNAINVTRKSENDEYQISRKRDAKGAY